MRVFQWRRGADAAIRLFVLSLGGLSACDFPTDVPRWDTRWVIPAENTSFPVAQLLPGGIALTNDGEAFAVPLSAISISRTLREICAACSAVDGLTVPKPPFTVSFGGDLELPEGLLAARLLEGGVEFRLRHDFPFDPLRPSATARGYLLLSVRSGSTLLARDSIDGRSTALPPGRGIVRTLQLQTGDIAGPLEVGITLHSPLGDPVTIDLDDRLVLDVPPGEIAIADARVLVSDRSISTPEIVLDMSNIETTVSERVQGGAVQLQITNPFDISGEFELRIVTPTGQVVRPVEIAQGESNVRIELNGDEMRSMLGQSDVRLSLAGVASSAAGGTEVHPSDEIALAARLEMVVATRRD